MQSHIVRELKMDYRSRKDISYDDDVSQGEEEQIPSARGVVKNLLSNLMVSDPNALLKANPRFGNYKEIFDDLLKESRIMTLHPIITCMISYDSTRAILVTKKGERE